MESVAPARSGLARAHLQLGDPVAARAVTAPGRQLPYPIGKPAIRVLDGLALLELHRPEDSKTAFTNAVAVADELLCLTDHNVAALQARALALSGLAVVIGDPARATKAGQGFAQAQAVTTAAGVTADTRRLLDTIAGHDRFGILAEIRAAQNP